MFCPLKVVDKCPESQDCAWWHFGRDCCSILTLADSIEYLPDELTGVDRIAEAINKLALLIESKGPKAS